MAACPQCSKPLRELSRRCPSCQADLDLLVDFVSHLQGGIQRAENLTTRRRVGRSLG
jgi:predicted amidophosphoribosyltransferase